MTMLYSTSATAVGGREGQVKTENGSLNLKLEMPTGMGGKGGATNPEDLFASGYSACFNGALNLVARMERVKTGETSVTITISLNKTDAGDLQLAAKIVANVPGVAQEEAQRLVEKAHQVCPYSRATRGNIDVELVATNK